jgi:hypothetical protein
VAFNTVTLNPGVGGANVAFWLASSNAQYQYIVESFQSTNTSDPSPVTSANPLPVGFPTPQAIIGNVVAGSPDNGAAGVKLSAIYNTSSPTYTTGNRADLQTDINGNLKVNIVAGGGSGGTSSTFGASFPSLGSAIGFLNSAGTLMQAGNLDASGNLKVNIAAGSVQAVTDNSSAFVSGATQGLAIAGAYNDTTGSVSPGNMGVPRITLNRQLRMVLDACANGGLTYYTLVAPSTPSKVAVKSAPGQIGFIHCVNTAATAVYIKIFDAASASVTLGTTPASFQFGVPGNTAGAGFTVPIPQGVACLTAITLAVTNNISLTDNNTITAASVALTLGYA